jgi:hypothetical protein
MAFNIMDLFGPGALNRLLQPAQAQGVQNFLANPGAGQQQQAAPPLPAGQDVATLPVAGAPLDTAQQVDPWLGMREQDVVRPDQMQTASTGQRSSPVQRAPFGDVFNKEALNDIFTGWAMGSTPSESIAKGAQLVAANRGTRQNVNQTVSWLKSKGMDEQQAKMLAASPPALNEYLKTLAEGSDPMRALQMQKAQLEIENLRNPTAKLTDDQREYQAAKDQGFEGSFMDYQVKMKEAGRSQINLDTGEKLPSGYRWVDPNDKTKGVQPIPGGPGEQIPGELAARVGMSESFAGQAPALRERLQSGEMTGPIDSLMGQFGMGSRGETYRQLQSGTDALMRLLTGAGMNETEARAYAERYLPTMKDTPDSAVGKLDQLMRELEAAKGMAMRGRGGAQPDQAADPLGIR